MRARPLAGFILVVSILVTGCGGSRNSAGKITGEVKLDGKAYPQVQLSFVPADDQKLSGNTARTDDQGAFEVHPNPNTKVTLKPGKYNVYFSKKVDKDGKVPPPGDPMSTMMMMDPKALKETVPAKYVHNPSFPTKPLIVVEITKGDNKLQTFELKSK